MLHKEKIVQLMALLFGSLNVINSGMVYGWPAASLPKLLDPTSSATIIPLTTWEGTWLTIAPFLGALLTFPLSYSSAGLIGPKKTIMFSFYPYIASWILISLSNTFEMLLFARLIAGISDSCIFNSFPIYIDDICNNQTKRRYYSLYPISFAFGILIINVIANSSSVGDTAVIACVFIFISLSGLLVVPESPYFLLTKNKTKQAKEALRFSKREDEVEDEYEKLKEQVLSRGDSELDLGKILSTPIRTNLCIGIILISAQQLSGITPIVFFVTTVLKETDVQFFFDTNFSIILFSLLLVMAVFTSLISDSKTEKNLLLYSLIITASSLICLGFYFQSVDFRNDFSFLSTIPIASVLIYVIFFGLGLQNIPYVYMNRMYSRNIKSKCLALIYTYFSVIASAVSLFFTWANDSREIFVVFYFFGGCCIISFMLVLLSVPKCKDWCEEAEWLLKSHESEDREYEFLLSSFELSEFSD